MSRDNRINIKAGRDVNVEALAVGDQAQAAAIHAGHADEIAKGFMQLRTQFDALEAKGVLKPEEAAMLRDETDDVHDAAKKALKDPTLSGVLSAKLKRLTSSVQTFCEKDEGVAHWLHAAVAACSLALPLVGVHIPHV
jgi:hypothetical protein